MTKKGLFDSLFIFIMILFLVPAVTVPNPAHNIIETKNYVNLVSLNLDEIIKGSVFSKTNDGCSVKESNEYKSELENKFDSFLQDTKKIYNVHCSYNISNIDGSVIDANNGWFSSDLELVCRYQDNFSKIIIKKEYDFNKVIEITNHPCNINNINISNP